VPAALLPGKGVVAEVTAAEHTHDHIGQIDDASDLIGVAAAHHIGVVGGRCHLFQVCAEFKVRCGCADPGSMQEPAVARRFQERSPVVALGLTQIDQLLHRGLAPHRYRKTEPTLRRFTGFAALAVTNCNARPNSSLRVFLSTFVNRTSTDSYAW